MKLFFFRPQLLGSTLLLLLACYAPGASEAPQQDPATSLVYLTEEYPPANFTQNGKLIGLSPELLKAMWKQMGVPEQPISVVPWSRGYAEVQNTPGTVLFTMSRNQSRETSFQWVGPLFVARHNLVSLKSNHIQLDSLGDAKKYLTAVIRDDISEISMVEKGFTDQNLVRVSRIPQALEMLMAGRIQFVCVSEDGLVEWSKSRKVDLSVFSTPALVNEQKNYFAFHKSTPPKLVARFQAALNAVRLEHQRLLEKYGLFL